MIKTRVHLPISDLGRKVKIYSDLPTIFLAGPIRNAPKWQESAIQYMVDRNTEAFIASPTRSIKDSLLEFVEKDRDDYQTFTRQRAWEQHYLYEAAENGCIVFFLPKEGSREYEDKVYAHITMMELGQWIVRKKYNPDIKLVIGTDGEFPEWSTIEFELKTEIPDVPICYNLEDTINTALELI